MTIEVTPTTRKTGKLVVAEKKLPFEPLEPNAETIAAIKALRAGKGRRARTVAALMKELNS